MAKAPGLLSPGRFWSGYVGCVDIGLLTVNVYVGADELWGVIVKTDRVVVGGGVVVVVLDTTAMGTGAVGVVVDVVVGATGVVVDVVTGAETG